jgi:surface antigen
VLAWRDRQANRRSLYSGTGTLRLCWRWRRLPSVAALLCGLAAGGCSFQLHSLLSKDEGDGDQTGSISRPGDQAGHQDGAQDVDLVYARAAASDVLARSGKDTSMPWQNPATGAGGNITPLATGYSEGGLPCRNFLASYEHGGSHDWLQGAACRTAQGNWEVKSLKSLKSS